MPALIFEERRQGLAIRRHDAAPRPMVELAAATVWGSGGTRYRMRDVETKLRMLAGSEFLTLELNGQVIGIYVLREKRVMVGDAELPAWYRTFLALAPEYGGRGYGSLLVREARRHCTAKLGGAGLIYGYIEADNARSLAAATRAGYQAVAGFNVMIFSRVRPHRDARCRVLNPAERQAMTGRLTDLYRDHVMLDFDQSLDPGGYWVLEHEDGIAAGVQVEQCDWRVCRLPGIGGALLVHVISRTPVLRRLFDARHCRFVKLGNLFTRPGQESLMFPLLETVLACNEVKAAMIFQDPGSPVFRRIAASGRLGPLNAGIDVKVHVMAALIGLSDEQDLRLRRDPMVISPADIG